jgi:hypothetical protein
MKSALRPTLTHGLRTLEQNGLQGGFQPALWSLAAFGAARLHQPSSKAGSTMPRRDEMSIDRKIQEQNYHNEKDKLNPGFRENSVHFQ